MQEERKKIFMVGNTHIDPVWLWNRAEGMQEVKSSFVSALERLAEFPDFKFTHSSIVYLEWLKINCPSIFEEIQQREKEGRWVIAGGMWVEPDCDIPCGESHIRHFLYSKRFLKQHFCHDVDTVYNVDSFGHCSNLPNIFVNCGMKNYLISRPGRHSIEVPPVFLWKSKDGSTIPTEMTGGEYMAWTKNAIEFNLEDSIEVMEKYGQNKMAVFYGVGNHGGGPTIENIHSIYELMAERKDLDIQFASIRDFFDAIDESELPVMEMEIGRIFYGCYSSDNEIKRMNRTAEWKLIKAEAMCSMAKFFNPSYEYPSTKLEDAWKEVLFNQFHDVLAGTSIERARNEAVDEFRYAIATARKLTNNGIQAIANSIDTRGEGFPLILFNTTGSDFRGVVFADVYAPRAEKKPLRIRNPEGKEEPFAETAYQFETKESRKGILLEGNVPAYGYSLYRVMFEGSEQTAYSNTMVTSERKISNGIVDITFDAQTGCPASIKKNDVEFLSSPMSVKVFYDDRGAWGVKKFDGHLLGQFQCVSTEIFESNFMRTVYRSCLKFEKSEVMLDFILEKDSDFVKINGWIHNHERHAQITLSVPYVDKNPICQTETCFIVENRVINDGSEFYQHRFADVGEESGKGLAVFNTTAYGMRQDGKEYLCILSRSSMFARGKEGPEELSMKNRFMDQGAWEFELGLLPHDESIRKQALFKRADQMHLPIEYLGDSNHTGQHWVRKGQVLSIHRDGVAPSALKCSEEDTDSFVVRMFETEGKQTEATVKYESNSHCLSLNPFEVKTVLLNCDAFKCCNMVEETQENNGEASK